MRFGELSVNINKESQYDGYVRRIFTISPEKVCKVIF